MNKAISGRIASRIILVVMAMQACFALYFIVEFFADIFGIRTVPPSYTQQEFVQISAWIGLVLSIVLNAVLLRRILSRSREMEQSVKLAQGAFQTLLEEQFDAWALTPSERDVALMAMKGYSNAEIAGILGKSEGTVKSQSNSVFRKADVSGRVQLLGHFMGELIEEPLLPGEAPAQSDEDSA